MSHTFLWVCPNEYFRLSVWSCHNPCVQLHSVVLKTYVSVNHSHVGDTYWNDWCLLLLLDVNHLLPIATTVCVDRSAHCCVYACAMDLAYREDLVQGLNWKHCTCSVLCSCIWTENWGKVIQALVHYSVVSANSIYIYIKIVFGSLS